ncbi:transmembrane protein 183 isoform X2 [Parasteatoda tepidariorum]|uniref:transmembrane protein 183 isoform X2 n=1 Tax=Parasteatoda tepidariorum TaxID=114398 RepID=UPI00077FC7BA|nr:transmembrane protein 183 isoform X2 [Parasteatoda tepidariorum]
MPKRSKKGLKKNNTSDIALDVKLSDFANSSARTGRLRKSVGCSFNKEIANICNAEEMLWYERDLEEFQLLEISTENRKKQLRSKALPDESQSRPGIRYPIDVWFLIGQAIQPEDVKKFALICKDSYFVSRSYSFWLRMYKRYYSPNIHLPIRLQPDCIEQSYCLKTSVIRALYYMYPLFINRIASRSANSDIYCLSNLCCTLMWRIQEDGKWVFYFKFQTNNSCFAAPLTYGVVIKDLWNSQDSEQGMKQETYVNHNPDEGCKILKLTCSHFVVVPQLVMGSRLSDVRINLAHDMRRQKLQLSFSYANYRQSNSTTNNSKENGYGDVVEFDAVENLMVLNWWHPQYPSDHKI